MRLAVLLGVVALALGGCASRSISVRSVPSEYPAAENAAAVESAAAYAAAAATADTTAREALAPVMPADAPSMDTYDPWERLNRFTYRFNTRFDEAVFLPVSNAYRGIPSPIRSGVHNFFGNLSEIDSVINYALQWRLKLSARSLVRFVINTTVGIGGLFDAAAKLRLPGAPTGLSATLAKWGIRPGPYLVVPILGPSTLRDGIGLLGDYGASYGVNIANLYRGNVSWALGSVNAVDQRSNVNFRYYATGSPFEYENVRFLYVRKRLIEDAGLRAK
ncbi:MAG TPA: VacJ family lipoprotein [Steroidobacteraceae bacterium]|jgi:phospholipid-binding lipoprotein MlaA|nr:VacJ family lipoprotein [Steroidobacteraceae bacterium]